MITRINVFMVERVESKLHVVRKRLKAYKVLGYIFIAYMMFRGTPLPY